MFSWTTASNKMLITKHRSEHSPIKLNVDYILSCVHSLCPNFFKILNPRQSACLFSTVDFRSMGKKADRAVQAATKGIDKSNIRSYHSLNRKQLTLSNIAVKIPMTQEMPCKVHCIIFYRKSIKLEWIINKKQKAIKKTFLFLKATHDRSFVASEV